VMSESTRIFRKKLFTRGFDAVPRPLQQRSPERTYQVEGGNHGTEDHRQHPNPVARFPPSKGDCIGRATKCRNRPEIGSLPPKTFHLTEGTGTGEPPGLLHFMPGDVGELQRGTDLHTPYTPPNSGDVFSGGHRPGRRGGALREGGPCLADVTVDTCVFQGQHTAFRPENLHTMCTPPKRGYEASSVTP